MARILLLIVIALLAIASFRGLRRSANRDVPPARSEGGETMVACARCGVNQPRSIALFEGGEYFCKDNPRCRP
ncbi:MAG TPA: PP0621 family protein [Usitatibacter sp.]|nr:PP0621 family protein [Usitatibacter sp.]